MKIRREFLTYIAILFSATGQVPQVKLAKCGEVLAYYFKALATFEKVLGKDHPKVSDSYNNISTRHAR
jgi:hypothetical protein